MIIYPTKFTNQPQYIPRIDRGLSITRGIVDVLLPIPGMIDVLKNQGMTPVGAPVTTFVELRP